MRAVTGDAAGPAWLWGLSPVLAQPPCVLSCCWSWSAGMVPAQAEPVPGAWPHHPGTLWISPMPRVAGDVGAAFPLER